MFNIKANSGERRIERGDNSYDQGEYNPLNGYEEVPRDDWLKLDLNTFIKWENTTGKITRGGFIIGKSYENRTLHLSADLADKTKATWNLQLSTISRMWKKIRSNASTGDITILARTIKNLAERLSSIEQADPSLENTTIETLHDEIAQMKYKIDSLENDVRKLAMAVYETIDVINKL